MMNASLWLALMMSSCCVSSLHEEQSTSPEYDYSPGTPTPTPEYDYDYTVSFDVDYVTGTYNPRYVHNKASGIGWFGPVLLLGLAVHQIWN